MAIEQHSKSAFQGAYCNLNIHPFWWGSLPWSMPIIVWELCMWQYNAALKLVEMELRILTISWILSFLLVYLPIFSQSALILVVDITFVEGNISGAQGLFGEQIAEIQYQPSDPISAISGSNLSSHCVLSNNLHSSKTSWHWIWTFCSRGSLVHQSGFCEHSFICCTPSQYFEIF